MKGRKEARTGDFMLTGKRGLVNKVTFQLLGKYSDVCCDCVSSWPGYVYDGQREARSFPPEIDILVGRDTPCRHFRFGRGWEVIVEGDFRSVNLRGI